MESTLVSFEQVANSLELKAANNQVITYNDFADELGLMPINNLFSNSALKLFFEQIDADDAEEQRPFRTALVVLKSSGRPGSGFYRSLELHRGIQIEPSNEAGIWNNEMGMLTEYYDPKRTKTKLLIELSHAQYGRVMCLCEQTQRSPEALVQGTLSRLLSFLEHDFALMKEASTSIERGEFLEHEEVFNKLNARLKEQSSLSR